MNEVMLDRWLLDQIRDEYELEEIDSDIPTEELSYEVLELL